MRRQGFLAAVGVVAALVLALGGLWLASAQVPWPPVKVDLTIQQEGSLFTATVWVRNEGDFDTDTLNIRGQVPKGAKYVDSWAGSGRGFNKGVFDGNDVGWANAGVKAGGRQGPFVYMFDTSALSPSSPASVAAWVGWAGKVPGNSISKAVKVQTPAPSLDVAVGTPPPVGWIWAVAEVGAGETEVVDGPQAHGFFWVLHTFKGANELSMAGETKVFSSGEAVFVPAGQQHTHRYSPQSRILIFGLHSADNPPSAFHRGKTLLASEAPIGARQGVDYRLQVRDFSLAPGEGMAERVTAESSFVYVTEGTLTSRVGGAMTTTGEGVTAAVTANARQIMSNEGSTPLRFILAEVVSP